MDSPSNPVDAVPEAPAEQRQVSQEKELQFYAATVASWFETQLEYDRSLLTLSSAGVALLVTLLSTVGAESKLLIGLYIAALLCFIVCMWSVLSILKQNAAHLVELINNKATKDDVLAELDERAKSSFLLGVLFSAAIGIVSAFQPHEGAMSKPHKPGPIQESFNGASSLRPQEITKSFNGASALRPAAPAATGGTTSGASNPQSGTSQTTTQSSNSSAQKP